MTYELHTGINGSGNTTWLVVVVSSDGAWQFIHTFDNEVEVQIWMEWCTDNC